MANNKQSAIKTVFFEMELPLERKNMGSPDSTEEIYFGDCL